MNESENPVLTDVVDGVGIMTLNRPDKFNCISTGLMDGMSTALEAFDNDQGVRVILLNANGKTFCTGADLDEVMAAREDSPSVRRSSAARRCSGCAGRTASSAPAAAIGALRAG